MEFQGTKLANGTSGCMLVSVLAENVTTGITSYFVFKPAVPDKGLSIDAGTLSDKERESAAWNYCDGRVGGLQYGNNQYGEKMLDFTVSDDFAVAVVDVDPTISYSTFDNMIMGGVLTMSPDSGVTWDKYNILGVQGVRGVGSLTNDLDFKYFLYEDGKTINPNLKKSDGTGFITADNGFVVQDSPVLTFETKYAVSSSNIKGTRMAYVLGTGITFNEGSGTDSNKIAVTSKRLSDVTYMEKYLAEGLSFAQDMETVGTDEISRVDCKMIIEVAGGGVPTASGVAGDQIAVVDSVDGTVEMYKFATTWIDVPVTSVLAKGAKLFATQVDDALTGGTAVVKNCYISVKTAGATTAAIAVNWKTNTDGSGTDTYVMDIFNWNYAAGNFIPLVGNI